MSPWETKNRRTLVRGEAKENNMKEMDILKSEATMHDILEMAKDNIGLKNTEDIGKNLAITGMVVLAVGGALIMVGKILMDND